MRLKLGVLGSGRGSNLEAIARSIACADLPAEIRLVFSDVPGAPIGEVARRWGVHFEEIPSSAYRTRLDEVSERYVASRFLDSGVEWVLLAGYMRVVKAPLLEAFPGRILNIHPSLLPKFPGREAWKQALEAGVSVSGCSVHVVSEEVDGGPVLARREVPVLPGDTPESLHARIQNAEHLLFPEVLRRIAAGRRE